MDERIQHLTKGRYRIFKIMQKFLFRVLCYGLLWMVLAGGRMDSWLLGMPAIALASLISMIGHYDKNGWFSISGGIGFVGFFLKASLISGFDVVRRAFHPRNMLDPDLIEYRLSLSTEAARIFMADIISLLPGTLSTQLSDETLTIHVLDKSMPVRAELKALEMRVAAMLERNERPLFSRKGSKT